MLTPLLLASALLSSASGTNSGTTIGSTASTHRAVKRHVRVAAAHAVKPEAKAVTPSVTPSAPSRFISVDMDLPALGTDRRVILTDMRKELLKNTDATGGRLVFNGGPGGWRGVDKALYDFDGTALERIELVFRAEASDADTRSLFLDLRNVLAKRNGMPSFDRVRDGDASIDRGIDALASHKHASSWASAGVKTQLVASYGDSRSVRVVISRDPRSELAEFAGEENRSWALADLTKQALAARSAADTLFDDFGEQPTIIDGARAKGKPLAVHLKSVNIPKGLAGVRESTVSDRFARFADGHWDVDAATASKDADVELVVEVLPGSTADRYTMRLSAVIARGARRGETLYTAVQSL